jgi:Apoptosis antagonizing transcription factor
MFAEVDDNLEDEQQSSSKAATDNVKLWETIIGLRISLQRSLDIGNKIPGAEFLDQFSSSDKQCGQSVVQVKDGLKGLLGDLNHLLEVQAKDSSSSKKRKLNEDLKWEDIVATQQKFRPSWETTVNKWHARLHFGSEQVKSKMKVFNQTIWEQVSILLES